MKHSSSFSRWLDSFDDDPTDLLQVSFDFATAQIQFWHVSQEAGVIINQVLFELRWIDSKPIFALRMGGREQTFYPSETLKHLNALENAFEPKNKDVVFGYVSDRNFKDFTAGKFIRLRRTPGNDWSVAKALILSFSAALESRQIKKISEVSLGAVFLKILGEDSTQYIKAPLGPNALDFSLLNPRHFELKWSDASSGVDVAKGRIKFEGERLSWELKAGVKSNACKTSIDSQEILHQLFAWFNQYPIHPLRFSAKIPDYLCYQPPVDQILNCLVDMVAVLGPSRTQERNLEKEARLRQNEQWARQQEKERERRRLLKQVAETEKELCSQKAPGPETLPAIPAIETVFELSPLSLQQTSIPLSKLSQFFLKEKASLWWVSNQSDDLLCLPHCRIEKLEFQVRTALRVLGTLKGRALLSDEVGLGKTIEAGLILKELLIRGMVKRFLILTVPSIVDQWAEELEGKFGIQTTTTNNVKKVDPSTFWQSSSGLIASVHTLKQAAQLEEAKKIHWDMVVVDEAHYLRNRESQAWQAVNSLPRTFQLLLTATPVQNSLEELYNLVLLLRPGQLPSPKEFRSRFMDPKKPRQPKEPEQLRRLLGQVMIRNTRANSGIQLPSRKAETLFFQPSPGENDFWKIWEGEFRERLAQLEPSQASFWGRLVLQAAGSSPAAWRSSLKKFPDSEAAGRWRNQTVLEESWRRKCELLLPLTRLEGGIVVFTQFLDTQQSLLEFLKERRIVTHLINGSTPADERQPITEAFRKSGGVLILTRSGTEGRNLQFCHGLANFDLPWNPMEIEQRIGRLHRIGQVHPVRICNFVQQGTLQEHILEILQEKLNLFELVVGETGVILGERFTEEDFAEEIFKRWNASEGNIKEAFDQLGQELVDARNSYKEIKELDSTLFSKDYEAI